MDRRFRVARLWSNEELRKIAKLFGGRIVNVSAGDNIDKEGSTYDTYFSNASEFWTTNHNQSQFRGFQGRPNELLLDLSKPIDAEFVGGFDVVFNHTTLEHIFEVERAFANLCSMSRDIVSVVVPFAQVEHETEGYRDYWRFTPGCLRRLFETNGLNVIYEAVSPHPNAAIYLFFVGSRHPDRWHTQMPPHTKIKDAGAWIGSPESRLCRMERRLRKLLSGGD